MKDFSLSSAIIGAFITALFAYFVRLIILKIEKKEQQERLTLLYLTRVTQIIAWEQSFVLVYKETIEEIKEKFLESNQDYILHRVCVLISKILQDPDETSKLLSKFNLNKIFDIAKISLNEDPYFGYKINDELLLSLPLKTVIQYNFFMDRISHINYILKSWSSAFKTNNFSKEPDVLFYELSSFRKLVDSAYILRDSLITEANINKKEADYILSQQVKYYATELSTFEKDKKIIEIIQDAIKNKN